MEKAFLGGGGYILWELLLPKITNPTCMRISVLVYSILHVAITDYVEWWDARYI